MAVTYAGFPEFLVAWVVTQMDDLLPILGGADDLRVSPYQGARKDPQSRVTFMIVSGHDEGTLSGPSGLKKERWTVDCWGEKPIDARTLARLMAGTKADRRLDGYSGTLGGLTVQCIRLLDERDESQPLGPGSDAGNPCISQDYEVWSSPN